MSTLVLLNSETWEKFHKYSFMGRIILYCTGSATWSVKAYTALSTLCTKVAKDQSDATPYQPTTLRLLNTILNCIFYIYLSSSMPFFPLCFVEYCTFTLIWVVIIFYKVKLISSHTSFCKKLKIHFFSLI